MNELKKKVLQIQKMAQDKDESPPPMTFQGHPRAPGGTNAPTTGSGEGGAGRFGPAPGTPSRPVYHGGGGGGGNPQVTGAIKQMQQAMQAFAKSVTTYSIPKQQPGQAPGQAGPPDSKKPFNDFIIEQYVAGSDIKGEEYSTDQKRVTQQQKEEQATDLLEMNIVVDGLRRIGSPQSELNADNAWDFRTNNALKNVYAFAFGLVKLADDFGKTNVQSFSDEDLKAMAGLIPADPAQASGAEKMDKAKQLTPLIVKLTRFYKYYVDAIATHPAWTRYISGDESMMSLQRGGGDPTQLDADQQKMMANVNSMQLGEGTVPNISFFPQYGFHIPTPQNMSGVGVGSLPLLALQDTQHLQALMTNMGWPRNQAGDPRYQKMVLDAIRKTLDAVIALARQQQSSSTPPPAQTGQVAGVHDRGVTPGGPGPVAGV